MSVELDVETFMRATDQLGEVDDERRELSFRISLIDEMYANLIEALKWGEPAIIAKESADAVYVIVSACVKLGIPFDDVWDVVHASNMSKLDDEGQPYRREDGKIIKGPNYVAPEPKIERLVRK